MIRKNKILLFSTLGILGTGIASTVCWSIVKTHESQKESKQVIKKDQFDLKEGELLKFEKSSKNMLAQKTAAYFKSQEYSNNQIDAEVNKIIGIYNDAYAESIEQNKQWYKEGLVGSVEDANYASLNMLNNEFNIDPIDLDKIETNIEFVEQSVQNESKEYKNQFEEKANLYNSEVKSQIEEFNLDNIEANLLFNDILEEKELLDKTTKELDNLETIANLVRPMIGSKITIRDDIDFNFAAKLKVYSKDGNVGYFAANNNDIIDNQNNVIVNDLIEANDMGDLFAMEYDLTKNTIFKETPNNIDYDSTNDVDVDEEETDPPFIYKLPMNGIEIPGGAVYGPGECYPGYQLLTQIINEDYITNSNYDTLTFKLGVWDKEYDPNQEHVIWFDDDLNMTANINVSTINQKRNIVDNYYYTEMETVPCNDFCDEENKEYFKVNQEESNRATINEVLDAAPVKENGEYDISEFNPYYIDPSSVNLEGISEPSGSWYYNGGHTNEKLQLKVVDVNTNVEGENNQALKCIWSICDTDPQTEEYVWVKDIQWTNHEEPIWVNFNYNKNDLSKLGIATAITKTISSVVLLAKSLNDNKIDEIDKHITTIYDINLALSIISTTAAIMCDAMTAVYMALTPFTAGITIGAIIQLVITSVIDLGFAAYTIYISVEEHKSIQDLHNIRLIWDSVAKWLSDEEMNQVIDWSEKLNNPRFNINDKLKIADKLEEFEVGDKWENFQKVVFNLNGMIDEDYEELKNNKLIGKDLTYIYWSMAAIKTGLNCLSAINSISLFIKHVTSTPTILQELRDTLVNQMHQRESEIALLHTRSNMLNTNIAANPNVIDVNKVKIDVTNVTNQIEDLANINVKTNSAIRANHLNDVPPTEKFIIEVNYGVCVWLPAMIAIVSTIATLAGIAQLFVELYFKNIIWWPNKPNI